MLFQVHLFFMEVVVLVEVIKMLLLEQAAQVVVVMEAHLQMLLVLQALQTQEVAEVAVETILWEQMAATAVAVS